MGKSTSTSLILKVTNAILRVFLNIIFYSAVVWVIITASRYVYSFSYQMFGSVPATEEPGKDIDFQIAKGESTMDIANKLEFNGLIVNKYSFYVKTKLKDYDIFPGTYILNTSMDYDDILAEITDQKNSIVKEEVITPTQAPASSSSTSEGATDHGEDTNSLIP